HIRENRAERKETQKVRKGLQTLTQKVNEPIAKQQLNKSHNPPIPGERVRIIGQLITGVVLSVQGKNATLQFGELKSIVPLTKLERVTGVAPKEPTMQPRATSINMHEKRAAFVSTLDVRGKRAEEMIQLLENFIDSAILLGQSELRILHGKGEGVLRKVVREQLKRYKEVASVSDEHVARGGDGITVVVLK